MMIKIFRVDLLYRIYVVCSYYCFSCLIYFIFIIVNVFFFKGIDLSLLIYLVIESILVLEIF